MLPTFIGTYLHEVSSSTIKPLKLPGDFAGIKITGGTFKERITALQRVKPRFPNVNEKEVDSSNYWKPKPVPSL